MHCNSPELDSASSSLAPATIAAKSSSVSPLAGRISRRPVVKGGVEKARQTRLERTCDVNFGKLAKWKHDEGARTLLVLEENDLSLTNHQAVAERADGSQRSNSGRATHFEAAPCIGSKPVLTVPKRHFRSSPINGHRQTGQACLKGVVVGRNGTNPDQIAL